MKNVKTIISSVITVIAIIVLGISIYNLNNLSNFSPQDDPEFQRIQSKLNDSMIRMIDLCTTTNHLGTLMSCKSESIPNLIDICNSEENVNLPICSDVKSKKFFRNIDERIEILSKDHLNKMATINSEIELAHYRLIESCYVKTTNLDFCKNSLLEMKNECVQNDELGNLSSCNDPRIEEIINRVPLQSDNYIDIVNNQVMELLASCTQVKTEACVNAAKQIMMACGIEATVQACSDPRLEEIANYDVQPILDPEIINPESTFEQIPIDTELQAMYARPVRDCIEETTALSIYVNTLENLDSISLELEMAVNSMVQDKNVTCADFREIESNYCYLFSSCTETGRFEAYWEIMPKLNSSFEQICTNTGELCYFNYEEN